MLGHSFWETVGLNGEESKHRLSPLNKQKHSAKKQMLQERTNTQRDCYPNPTARQCPPRRPLRYWSPTITWRALWRTSKNHQTSTFTISARSRYQNVRELEGRGYCTLRVGMQRKGGSGGLQELRGGLEAGNEGAKVPSEARWLGGARVRERKPLRSSVVLAVLGEAAAARLCRQGARLAGLRHGVEPFEEARPDASCSRCYGWGYVAPTAPRQPPGAPSARRTTKRPTAGAQEGLAGWPNRQQRAHWAAGAADHIALTRRARWNRRISFLMREGASVGETWITRCKVSWT